ncbi:rhodanese-like domain-containing protein [Nocardioides hungaricus]
MTSPSTDPVDVDLSRARELLADDALLLDVREDDEWALGHAEQAWHLPLGELDPAALPDVPVVVVCRSGNRSRAAARTLEASGRTRVYNLAGGMRAWRDAGLPVVRPDGSSGAVE